MIGYQILRIVLILLLVLTLVSGCVTIFFGGFVDFPCFARYSEESNCLELPEHMQQRREVQNPQIESYLDVYVAGWSGAGCDYEASPDQSLEIDADTGALTLKREGDILMINNRSLAKGEKYRAISVWNINPWVIARTDLYNRGVVADCGVQPPNPRLVVTGSYGTSIQVLKGGLITAILIAGVILTSRKIKALKTALL